MEGHASWRMHQPIPTPVNAQSIEPATRVIESPVPPRVSWKESNKIQVFRRHRL